MDWLIQGIIVTCSSALICSIGKAIFCWFKKENNFNKFLDFYLPLICYTCGVFILGFSISNFSIEYLLLGSFSIILNLLFLISSFNSKN